LNGLLLNALLRNPFGDERHVYQCGSSRGKLLDVVVWSYWMLDSLCNIGWGSTAIQGDGGEAKVSHKDVAETTVLLGIL